MAARWVLVVVVVVAAAAASAGGMRAEPPETVSAALGDLSGQPCGCMVCPCAEVRTVRTIEGLDKLSASKAQSALPIGWRPLIRVDGCPCPVPAPCDYSPCEPPPCPCTKSSEFFFADLVDELGIPECTCPPPKKCVTFPCEDDPPCPCKAGTMVKPEISEVPLVPPASCVGPGACLPQQSFREPEYAEKLRNQGPVRYVKQLPPIAQLQRQSRKAPAVTEKEAAASYNSARSPPSSSGSSSSSGSAAASKSSEEAPLVPATASDTQAQGPSASQKPIVSISKDTVLPPTLKK